MLPQAINSFPRISNFQKKTPRQSVHFAAAEFQREVRIDSISATAADADRATQREQGEGSRFRHCARGERQSGQRERLSSTRLRAIVTVRRGAG